MNAYPSADLMMAFERLLVAHKSHTKAALAIGLTPGHYRKIRHGRANIPKTLANLIILKAMTAAQEAPDTAPVSTESVSEPPQTVTG